jgi:hypothetical protein
VYDVPDGLGLIEKVRGKREWSGFCWVSPGTVSDMLLLLPHVSPLYISIHERKVGGFQRICQNIYTLGGAGIIIADQNIQRPGGSGEKGHQGAKKEAGTCRIKTCRDNGLRYCERLG